MLWETVIKLEKEEKTLAIDITALIKKIRQRQAIGLVELQSFSVEIYRAGGKMYMPFKQKKVGNILIREFSQSVDSLELAWHRDKKDRFVRVAKGKDWKLQIENCLPIDLLSKKIYFIPKNTYHRIIKGRTDLVVEIREVCSQKGISNILKEIL